MNFVLTCHVEMAEVPPRTLKTQGLLEYGIEATLASVTGLHPKNITITQLEIKEEEKSGV